MDLSIVILAAGQGKRMYSQLPKVLHRIAGKTLLEHVYTTAAQLDPAHPPIIVYGHRGEIVRHTLAHLSAEWLEQTKQLGTGHALQQVIPYIPRDHRVLVLYGDVPLVSLATLKQFIQETPSDALGIITATLHPPTGFGRMLRNAAGDVIRIVEEKDATETERALSEINSGIYLIPAQSLTRWLPQLNNNNAQQEYYLTDIVPMAVHDHVAIHTLQAHTHEEILGVNDKVQLNYLERYYQRCYAEKLMRQGVTLYDPARFDMRGELTVGHDVVIDINVIIEGNVTIGNHCVIGANVLLRNVVLQDYVEIKANSIIEGAEIADHSIVGPFARIRPGTVLGAHAHIGNFVEIKNSRIEMDTKINHLSYIGDSQIGKKVNVGAGTITCNYDGLNKHRTIIEDDVFIGSNSQLIAPITIGKGATIGAGSTISRDAPAHQLTLTRAEQRTIANWHRPVKKIKKEQEL